MFLVAMPRSLTRDYLKEEGFVLANCLRAQNGEGMARGARCQLATGRKAGLKTSKSTLCDLLPTVRLCLIMFHKISEQCHQLKAKYSNKPVGHFIFTRPQGSTYNPL